MAEFEAEALRRGARRAFLEVAADNTAARALYEALGYATAATRPGYYRASGGSAVDATLMIKRLRND